jgi:hypothetical protein
VNNFPGRQQASCSRQGQAHGDDKYTHSGAF